MSNAFKDKSSRTWIVEIDGVIADEVQAAYGINLLDLSQDALDRLEMDPLRLVNVLWLVCREQAEAAGVDERSFKKSLRSEVIGDATRALINGTIGFFPPGKQSLVRSLQMQNAKVRQTAMERNLASLEDPAMQERLARILANQGQSEVQKLLKTMESELSNPEQSAVGPSATS